MVSKRQPPPLVVIVGPTASGKSALALQVAKAYGGEIICADSRTIYRGMDIGTAKPEREEQDEVPHHLLDIVEPDEFFTAAEFKARATEVIENVQSRGKLPILVGGTGLYIDGVIFDFAFLPPVPSEEREQLQSLSVAELQQRLTDQGISMPQNASNPRHLIRALETNGAIAVRRGLRENTLVIGLDVERSALEERVKQRIDDMIMRGLENEVRKLTDRYGWNAPGVSAVGYREWQGYFTGMYDADKVKELIKNSTMQYAKRQRTWFKRNPYVRWVKNGAEADTLLKSFLQE